VTLDWLTAFPSLSDIFNSFFLDNFRRYHANGIPNERMLEIEEAYYQDERENIPASVETQCQWLLEDTEIE